MAKITGDTEYKQVSVELDLGAFATKYTVIGVENKSNHPNNEEENIIGANNFKPELCLYISLKDESDRLVNKYVFGKYISDIVTGKITGWITAGNGVLSFLYACVGRDNVNVNDDYSIPQSLLNKCIDKEIWKIDYVKGTYEKDGKQKPSYQMLNTFFPGKTPSEELIKYFQSKKHTLKDYNPVTYKNYIESKEMEDTSFNYGNNNTDSSAPIDLPF